MKKLIHKQMTKLKFILTTYVLFALLMSCMTTDINVNLTQNKHSVSAPKVLLLKNASVVTGWAVFWRSFTGGNFYFQLYNPDASLNFGGEMVIQYTFDQFDCVEDDSGKFSVFPAEYDDKGAYFAAYNYNTIIGEDDYEYIAEPGLGIPMKISSIYLPGNSQFMAFMTLPDNSIIFRSYVRSTNTFSNRAVFRGPIPERRNAEFASITGTNWIGVFQECKITNCNIFFIPYANFTEGTIGLVNTLDTGRYVFPSVHRTNDDGFIVVYKKYDESYLQTSIYGRIFGSNYTASGSQFEIKSSTINSVFTPLVTVSPSGIINVSYEEGYGADIYVIQFDSTKNGLPKDGSILNTLTSGVQKKVSIKFNSDGKMGAAYVSDDSKIMSNIVASTCSNIDIYLNDQGGNFPNSFGASTIRLKTLPVSGTIYFGESDAVINQDYDVTFLGFSPGTTSQQTFDYTTTYGFYESSVCTATINFCYVSCGSCNVVGNSSNHQCISCKTNYFPLADNTSSCHLSSEVITNYYFNTNKFSRCSADCESCISDTQCTKCTSDNFLLNGICYKNCPANYFANLSNQNCESCNRHCDICTNANTCTTCSATFYLKPDNTCTSDCPLKFFENNFNRTCESCPSDCDNCSNGVTCTKCSCNFFLKADNTCDSSCPFGQYGDKNLRKCVSCPLFYITDTNNCVDSCPIGYYHSLGSNECIPCIDNCDICSNGTECTLCSVGFLNLNLGSCTTNLDGYFDPADGDRKWKLCPSTCATCSSETFCLSCKLNFFFLPFPSDGYRMCGGCPNAFTGDFLTKNCESNCGAEEFYDRCSETCSTCNSLCSTCQDNTDYCSDCVSTAYSWESDEVSQGITNKCLNQCPFNYFYNFFRQCRTCKDLGYFQFGQQCEDFCPEGYFKDMNSHKCVECTGQDVFRYKDICIDTSTKSFRDLLVLNDIITYETVDKLHHLKYAMLENPSNFNYDLVVLITRVANNQTLFVLDGRMRPSEKLFSLLSTALRMNVIYASQNETVQNTINQLLENIHLLSYQLIKQYNSFGLFLYASDEYNLVISDSSAFGKTTQQSYALNMSIIETGECVAAMTKDYNLDAGTKLIIKKVDLSSIINLNVDNSRHLSDSIILEYYHPYNYSKLSTDACNGSSMIVKTKNNQALKINSSLYRVLREKNVDILDSNSQFYQDRCTSILDPVSGKDTTVGFRIRNFFQNTTVLCASNCNYAGLEESGYVVCNCSGVISNDEPINQFVDSVVVPTYSTINHEVIKCFPHVWEQEYIRANPAFWSIMFIIIIGWVIFLTMRNCGNNLIESSLDELIDNDCSTERLHYKKVVSSKVLPAEKNTGKELVIEVNDEDPPKTENVVNPENVPHIYTHTPYHQSTNRMYQLISPYKLSKEDNRSFLTLFKSFLIEEHFLVRIVYYKSLLNPLWVELYFFLFRLSVLFMMNALIFIDEYIDKRITSPYKVNKLI